MLKNKKNIVKEMKDLANSEIELADPSVKKVLDKYGKEFNKFQIEFTDRVILLMIVGLGLITSLAWDDALKTSFKYFSKNLSEAQEKFVYAILLTIFTATATVLFNKFLKKKSKKRKNKVNKK